MARHITFHLSQKVMQPVMSCLKRLKIQELSKNAAVLLFSLVMMSAATALDANASGFSRWVGTWGTAPAGLGLSDTGEIEEPLQLEGQTLRLIVHTSTSGRTVRIRVSNLLGETPLKIGGATIALQADGNSIDPSSTKSLSFSGGASIAVPPGASVVSDPVRLGVSKGANLAVSFYFPEPTAATTLHNAAFQTNYVAAGDVTSAESLEGATEIGSWPFLTGVEVKKRFGSSVVTLGDSITDGFFTTNNENRRWPDVLADRLRGFVGVINKGIGGNRLLSPSPAALGGFAGPAGLARLDRDVFSQSGVRYLVVLLGINDIGLGGLFDPNVVTAEQMIAGYRQVIARAKARGIRVYGATLLPFSTTNIPGYYTPEKDVIRGQVNDWIRNSGEFDAVLDFDKATQDPADPSRMLAEYDSGDGLHPNDAGMEAMANSIPLRLFWR